LQVIIIHGWVKAIIVTKIIIFNTDNIIFIRMIKSRRMMWTGHVAGKGEMRNAYGILVGKPEGKRPQGRPRRRWVDNIRMDLRGIGWDGMDCIDLVREGSCEHGNEPSGSIKCWEILD
jgi:hypothetical protein